MSLSDGMRGLAVDPDSTVRTLSREFVLFSTSTCAFQFSRMATALVVARWVGPAEFGVWNALSTLLLYGQAVALGVPQGVNREVPLLIGAGRPDEATRLENVSLRLVSLANFLACVLIVLVGVLAPVPPAYRLPLAAMAFLCPLWQLYQYCQIRLKSRLRFGLMSLQQLGFAVLLPATALTMSAWSGVEGFIAGQAAVCVVLIGFMVAWGPIRVTGESGSFRELVPMVRIGLPIMAGTVLYYVLVTLERWMILGFLGTEALGQYTLAVVCTGMLSLLPAVIAQQMYPRMALKMGRTGDKKSLRPLVIGQTVAASTVTAAMVATAYVLLPYVTERFLPQYVQGVVPARTVLLGLACVPLASGAANYLVVTNRQVLYVAVLGIAVIVKLGLVLAALALGWGLEGAAVASAVSFAITASTVVAAAWVAYAFKE